MVCPVPCFILPLFPAVPLEINRTRCHRAEQADRQSILPGSCISKKDKPRPGTPRAGSAPRPTVPALQQGAAGGQRDPRPPGSTCAPLAGAAAGPCRSFLFLARNTTTSTAGGATGTGGAAPAALSSARSSPKKPRAPRRPPAAACGPRLSSSSSSSSFSADGGTALASPFAAPRTRRGSSPAGSTCRGLASRRRSAPERPRPVPSPPFPGP